jgi:predicted nucleic acid-binding protein
VILLDTSVLVDALSGPRRSGSALRRAIARGARISVSTLVLYEWWRGPRLPEELAAQEALFPVSAAIPFGPDEAATAAALYRSVPRARGRELDLAIAACAICADARLWTLNKTDFDGIPKLRLV